MGFEGQAVWSVTSKHAVFQPHATAAADRSVCSPGPAPQTTQARLSAPAHHLTGSATSWSSQELSDHTRAPGIPVTRSRAYSQHVQS